ncbi:hypothetical protein KKH39_02760 [Patescibacteria group bacterium]|nr:hypothetical protein [Patescibacteria group bacterium]
MDEYKPISQKELERGYFFVTHRPQIIKVFYGLSILVLAILYIFLAWRVITYLQGGNFEKAAANLENASFDWETYHIKRAPINLAIGKPQFISLGERKYNLVVPIVNHNTDWALRELKYSFVVNGETLPEESTFLNPDETQLLILFSHESSKGVVDLDVELGEQDWQRVGPNFYDINFSVSNVKFQAATRLEVGKEVIDVPARVIWQAQNMTLNNFWDVGWQVVLYNGDKIIGVNYLLTHDFLALEKRELEVVWLDKLPRVTKVEVLPVINKMDKGNIKDIYVDNPSGDLINL